MNQRMQRVTTAVVMCFTCVAACARNPAPVAVAEQWVSDTSIFAPFKFPRMPTAYRGANGAPGPKYWQNQADYDLHATIDTAVGTVQGTMTLRYTNHSPDTLPFLWFQTEQNAFRLPDSTGTKPKYGYIIDAFTEVVDAQPVAVTLEEHQSETKVTLPRPIGPGETVTFQATWHFIVPPRTADGVSMDNLGRAIMSLRMGRDGTMYRIAQWYPRVNVYDDVQGWNIEPYNGFREFYLEYGNFTLAVTVPSNYVVAATGMLDNPQDVLTPTQIARLAQAARADTIVRVITAAELRDGTAHLKHDGMVTWKFTAKNVRDAVFVASPEYQWDATHWQNILTQAYYRPSSDSSWWKGADMARQSVQEYSERWFPYPYPHLSVSETNNPGPLQGGMEYPMLSFNSGDSYDILTHEMGHNWFPMIVGSNERVHGWMDEGFDTFINSFAKASYYHVEQSFELPSTKAPVVRGASEYNQPAALLQILRRDVLGPAVFDKAFRTYVQRWAFKHPTPEDFFRTMNDVSGKNLDWFWQEWFFKVPGFDQGIDSVTQTAAGSQTNVTVVYGNHTHGVLPLLVRFTFSDKTTQDISYPADVWRANSTRYVVSYTFQKPLIRIAIDPDHHLVDSKPEDNVWVAK